ncbi:TPA: mannose-6-phosphate isomerase, class I [Enterobacter asburiae]|nr:mannose-6-phosphate isomerase, class I [Enterobacter asburiae]HDR2865138.1 mannose-6-phosphate isomerase, class I [Enterobacter asburiae]
MSQTCFYPLTNTVKNYPWGSRHELNKRFNILNPDDQPQAELWMGVHPAGVSYVNSSQGRVALTDMLASAPAEMLGEATYARFKGLPFLLKILAAESALSIQVHPTKADAESGYERRQQANDDATPDYNDANHKPELVFAITPFVAMNGFRDTKTISKNLSALDISELNSLAAVLLATEDGDALSTFFIAMMQLNPVTKKQAISQVITRGDALYGKEMGTIFRRLQQDYPDDTGVLAPLFLNCITLQPGEAMFLYPGTLHAYIHGTAIEVMASSDNVLRAGLTSKKINLNELIHCTNFTPTATTSLLMKPEQHVAESCYPIPVEDFRFSIFTAVDNQLIMTASAEIILVIEGSATLSHVAGEGIELLTGQSVFIPASTRKWWLSTTGKVCRVSC